MFRITRRAEIALTLAEAGMAAILVFVSALTWFLPAASDERHDEQMVGTKRFASLYLAYRLCWIETMSSGEKASLEIRDMASYLVGNPGVVAGFERCDYHNLTGGIVAIHRGFKL